MSIGVRRIVLVAGGVPYLGGPLTWQPLREAAPEFDYTLFDTLRFGDAANAANAVRTALVRQLAQADGIIAHYNTAKVAVEALTLLPPTRKALFLSPLLVSRASAFLTAFRRIVKTRAGSGLLVKFATNKLRRLRSDREYVRKQMRLLVGDRFITDALLDEAQRRICDPRFAPAVEQTVQVVLDMTSTVTAAEAQIVRNAAVAFGSSPLEVRRARRFNAITIEGSTSAPMVEAPHAVAEILRASFA